MAERAGGPVTLEEAEREVYAIIAEVARSMSLTQPFGYHTPDDVSQIAFEESIDVLTNRDKYDFERPLANFLWINARNRIQNLKRRQFHRSEAPCKCCDPYNPGPSPCKRWESWARNNQSKQRIMCPASLTSDANLPAPTPSPDEGVLFDELDSYITARLPQELLTEYRTFVAEGDMPRARHAHVKAVLRRILEGSPYDPARQ